MPAVQTPAAQVTADQIPAAPAVRRRVVIVGGGMLGLGLARELADDCDVVVLEGAAHLGGLVSAWTLDTRSLDTGISDTGISDTGNSDGGSLATDSLATDSLATGSLATGSLAAETVEAATGSVTWDRFYHVVLSADRRVLALYDELGLGGSVHWSTVRSELLSPDGVLPMSTVADLLNLRVLRPVDRVRVGLTVGLGAVLPMGRRADSITAVRWVRRWSGRTASHDLWEPLLRAKLGSESEHTSSIFLRATFRRLLVARLRGGVGDRFGWVEGGYGQVLDRLAASLTERGVEIRCGTPVDSIDRAGPGDGGDGGSEGDEAGDGAGWIVRSQHGDFRATDVVVTAAGPLALRLLTQASAPVRAGLGAARYLGCVCVSVVLRRPITGAYLTYVTDETPYTAIVEMSNHVDPAQFGGHSLVYLPKYTSPDDLLMDEDSDVIAERFVADLIARYPAVSREDVLACRTARARYVMPVPVPGWSQLLPPFDAGPPGLWLASSVQVADGTLNVETTLKIAAGAADAILARDSNTGADTDTGTDTDTDTGTGSTDTTSTDTATGTTVAGKRAENRSSGHGAALEARPSDPARPVASVSLDADNLWSYLKTRGEPAWSTYPSYLHVLGPRLRELWADLDLTATVFVVGRDATTDDGAQFVHDLVGAGHEIANHSFEHEPWLHTYSVPKLESELERTENALQAAGAPRPVGFRGPGYSLSPDLLQLLAARGYTYDCTTLPTWIGPLARAYYLRGSGLSKEERDRRGLLFGSAREGTRRNKGYRWSGTPLVEIPVTTMPLAKVPIHISYLLQLHQVSPVAMRAYFLSALRLCRLTGTQPSLLMHPLDLLDAADAPGLEFFPGMALGAGVKYDVASWVLRQMQQQFDVVGTGEHARRLADTDLPSSDPATAGPRNR